MSDKSARMELGEAISYARQRAEQTQEWLAAFTEISRSQIANVEAGHSRPSIETLEEIARALGVRFSTDGHYWELEEG